MDCCGIGALSRLAIGLSSAPNPTRMDFISVHHTKTIKTLSDGSSQTIRGTLDPVDTNVGEGMLFVAFRTKMWMSAAKMDILLPCFGATEDTSDTFTFHDSLPPCKIIVGPSGSEEVTYDGCVVSDIVVMGRKGADPQLIDIGWVGKSRVPHSAGTFFVSQTNPVMVEGYTYPYPDGTYTTTRFNLEGADRYFPMYRISYDWGVISEFNQNTQATNLCPTQHKLTFGASALYSTCDSTTDLLTVPMSGDTTGDELVVDLERVVGATTYKTIFTIANAKLIAQDPDINKPDWMRLPINARGYALADGTPMLVVTNKAT